MRKFLLLTILSVLISLHIQAATTGKISGTITDSKTGEALIGVNVILVGTTLGASTDTEGYFVILNIPPGTYTLKASYIGYSESTVQNVRVNIDQTTNIDVSLSDEAIQTMEIVVVAQQPIVQKDVASSRVNLNAQDIENLPVANVQSVLNLQAGILSTASGPQVRGGGADQTAFVVNGITLRDERNNTPYTGISFTSIKEIQVQTGGFNAEFGNIRSGLVNVVTKEGDKQKYSVSFLGRYKPAGRKSFGNAANSWNSYWIRPYVDDAVAWTGTDNGAWDDYTKRQYESFRGWNTVSEQLLSDNDPANDLSPEAAQRLFLWQHRRKLDITKPDYDIDLSVTGPVPFVSQQLGGLTFLTAFRSTKEMYLIPLSRDSYQDYNFQFKLTSDVSKGMKLSVEGLFGKQWGTTSSRNGSVVTSNSNGNISISNPGIFRTAGQIADDLDYRSGANYLDSRIYATDYWAPTQKYISGFGLKFTHVINPTTYYDFTVSEFGTRYDTNPGTSRNTSEIYDFGGILYDEAPFGNYSGTSSGIGSSMNMGLGFSNSRDSSKINTWSTRFDLISQLDKFNNVKVGFEFTYTDNNANYALVEPALPSNNSQSSWHTFPIRGALYIQDKLEFEGMVANLGVRVDYSDANGDWYVITNPYDAALSGTFSLGIDTLLPKEATKAIVDVSPRIGIAFPISVDSKLFFNYGHFRSMPVPDALYLVRRSQVTQAITRLANPNNPLPKTIAYELGYEHNLFDEYLLRIAGYYKDITDQTRYVTYTSRDNSVSYDVPEPDGYEDIRGFEITMTKNRGEWLRGFVNYTYQVSTSGNFGLEENSENPATQRENLKNKDFFEQDKPTPRPYARANIDIFTPINWGPEFAGVRLLEDLRINLLATWRAGQYFSWTGPGGVKPGYDNNIQWEDAFNLDLRISKAFDFGPLNLEFFADILNAFNMKSMGYKGGFRDLNDFDDYMKSLHLPEEYRQFANSYNFVAGDDTPGDYRTGPYIPWDDNASESQKEEWRKNKSYIDMPNLEYTAFLNPRSIYWGIKFNYDLN